MKTLFILRHAKSSWDNAALSDFERPLNERGLGAAPLVGGLMKKNRFEPELILSSPARRAEQTATLIKQSAGIGSAIRFDERIYEASPARLLEVVSEQEEKIGSIMLVGHNPGLEGLLKFLTGELQPMPTAALAIVDLETDKWSTINSSKGKLRTLIRPKEIGSEK
jgi:phosphohistidine phosphatase